VETFLDFILKQKTDFAFLWEDEPALSKLAQDTFKHDIRAGAKKMRDAIDKIPHAALDQHGLRNRPLKFKLRVLNTVANRWKRIREQFQVGTLRRMLAAREWFKKIIETIDAVLDSLIEAASGAGGLIREFKDALRSLA
jgi:hypothetical protein